MTDSKTGLSVAQSRLTKRKGDVIALMHEGHDWGAARLPSKLRVEVQGAGRTNFRKYVLPEYSTTEKLSPQAPEGRGDHRFKTVRRRQWKVDVDDIPASAMALARTRDDSSNPHIIVSPTGDMTWPEFRALLIDRPTGTAESVAL